MKFVYVVAAGDWYKEVSKEEYDAFTGEKHKWPSHWRLMVLTEMLLPYRRN